LRYGTTSVYVRLTLTTVTLFRHINLTMSLHFAANLSFLFEEAGSLINRYGLARKAGFKGVECAFPYQHSVEELVNAKSNLEQILINTPPGDTSKGELGFAAIPGKEVDFIQSFDKALLYSKHLECKRIHIMAGNKSQDHTESQMLATYVNNLRTIVPRLESENIIGVIEPISRYVSPNYFLNSLQIALGVIKEINSPRIRLLFDVFHIQALHGDLTRNITESMPYIGHIQVAQLPGRHSPNDEGEINFQHIFKLISKLNYKDWIGLEYKPVQSTTSSLEFIEKFLSSV